jgi:paraquat-inducible protein A
VTQSPSVAHETIRCRRCRRRYALPNATEAGPGLLVACPNCGAAPSALWRKIPLRHNGVAAVLSVLAMIVLTVAIFLPFVSMTKLGDERVFSLVGGIAELFRANQIFIGVVLFTFSVVFPFAKLIALLVATSSLVNLSAVARRRLHHLAVITGKYSLLDILVVALMIILVKFKNLAEVRAMFATVLFCVAIFLSIAAGFFVDLDKPRGAPRE